MKKKRTQTQEVFGEEYKNWVANESDKRFDQVWNIIILLAFLIPTVLGGWLLWVFI